jgi:hypothetical protein
LLPVCVVSHTLWSKQPLITSSSTQASTRYGLVGDMPVRIQSFHMNYQSLGSSLLVPPRL